MEWTFLIPLRVLVAQNRETLYKGGVSVAFSDEDGDDDGDCTDSEKS